MATRPFGLDKNLKRPELAATPRATPTPAWQKNALMQMVVNGPSRKTKRLGDMGLRPTLAMQFKDTVVVLGQFGLQLHTSKTHKPGKLLL
jgi:hypothetical protein